MSEQTDRRTFIKGSLAVPAAAALSLGAGGSAARAQQAQDTPPNVGDLLAAGDALPQGRIGNLHISRVLLGGNLLTHFTHSRDLKYVYNLTAHYNTEAKILETLALAERHGVNTLSIHTVPAALDILKKHRHEHGGSMQWIICPTAPVEGDMAEYAKQVQDLVNDGVEAVYLWGVHGDRLAAEGKVELMAKAVAIGKEHGIPSGVGAHDFKVIEMCEKNKVGADFYIKTLHHHRYPTGPKPEELTQPYNEFPGYWCRDPQEVIDFMKDVEKPWLAFKVMAAGAIPPRDAFTYAFANGADHILVGMFDFEIAEDVTIAKSVLAEIERTRPWRS